MTMLLERAPTGAKPSAEQPRYRPYGGARDLWKSRDLEVILSGPADTGKSLAALQKIHLLCLMHTNIRVLLVRKTRRSLSESALVTYEQKVLPPNSPIAQGAHRAQRQSYRYPNGSEIVVGGMDSPDKVMSTEWDIIFVQEARDLIEDEWEALIARCRNMALGWNQVMGDTNPDAPSHWIKRRAARGQLRLVESRHEDNPTFNEQRAAILNALTGVRRKRLRDGLWVAAEGSVYEDSWDTRRNLVDAFDIPADWTRYLSIDFGFTNPFVCQWWAVDPDGRLYRYREIYRTQRLVEDHAHDVRRFSAGEPEPVAIVADHDAEDRATLEKHLKCDCSSAAGLPQLWLSTTPAKKNVSQGIQHTAARLAPAADGKPRLVLLRDSLVEPDELLVARKLPLSTEDEIEGYIWAPQTASLNPDGQARKDEPLKLNDHGCDAMRYMVAQLDLRSAMADVVNKPITMERSGAPRHPNRDPMTAYKQRTADRGRNLYDYMLEQQLHGDDE